MDREREIIKASFVGIVGNMLLVAFKLAVGIVSSSIAIILDAVNNATDALSSVITIVGTKLAGRRPDRRHPFGYGRIEYLTSMVIAVIILVAGLISLRESIDKIIHPATPSYSTVTIAVIIVAILAKIVIGIYFKREGDKTNSKALIASGIDSNYDAVLSGGTLVVALAQNIWNLNIDGIVGLIISLVVCKAGIEVLRDALGPIIGQRESDDYGQKIEEYVASFPGVEGAYDLILDDFGPNETIGSIHVEVADDMTARQIHELTHRIAEGLKQRYGIIATVGIYAANTTGEYASMHARLRALAQDEPSILQVHGFYVDEGSKTVYFDLVIDFKSDTQKVSNSIINKLKQEYPGYRFDVTIDTDYEG